MPVQVSDPGLYVQEIPSTAHTVVGVSTSATAFVDFFPMGPVGTAVQCSSWNDFQRIFGGLDARSDASYGIYQYFLNGGQTAWVIRLSDPTAGTAAPGLAVTAPAPGTMAAAANQPIAVQWTPSAALANASPAPTYELHLSLDGGKTFVPIPAAPTSPLTSPIGPTPPFQLVGTPTATGASFQFNTVPPSSTPMIVRVVAKDAQNTTIGKGDSGTVTLVPAVPGVTVASSGSSPLGSNVSLPLSGPLQVSWQAAPTQPDHYAILLSTDGGNTFPLQLATAPGNATSAQVPANAIATPPAALNGMVQVAAQNAQDGTFAAGNSAAFQLQPPALGGVTVAAATSPLSAAAFTLPLAAPLQVSWNAPATAPSRYAILLSTDGGKTFSQVGTAAGGATSTQIAQIATPPGASPGQAVVAVAAQDAGGRNLYAGNSAPFQLTWTAPAFTLAAQNPGAWGNGLVATITPAAAIGAQPPAPGIVPGVFNLSVQRLSGKQVVASESYLNLTMADPNSPQYAPSVVAASSLVVLAAADPEATELGLPVPTTPVVLTFTDGTDGSVKQPVDAANLLGNGFAGGNPLAPLDAIAPAVFNLLCLPTLANGSESMIESVFAQAMSFCAARQAFFLLDIPPTVQTVGQMQSWVESYTSEENYSGAVYFPRLSMPDPLNGYRPKNVAPSGTLAGVYAASDAAVGVWKAPAGTTAVLQGATPVLQMTDSENGVLNPLGVNALRNFPIYGNISWGARTLAGADEIGSEWKYIPVRRLVDYIEQSLVANLKWAVFQPNDQTLWANLAQEVSTFLQGLYNQGALFGATPAQAYFVTCDATTTTPTDIAQGIVNILIGVAPVNPAEFVILQIQQIAGQTAS
jgi:hypothetical protein